ncbi:hypothetical protein OESDEN_10538 [Oesophagostomum dentatum]|uniref:MADF domain-containing protein n=1 Tax=Oesophagostomum dentatum TaxID=61180 RepID=A0A0B1SWK6_OESDE|nr:hypothetical protein OESDEN_10538 [Oesophagostomum dentatum]
MKIAKDEPLPMKIELAEREKITLLEIIRHYEPLWNPARSGYKDYHVKRTCWNGVAEELSLQCGKNFELTEIQRVYRNLRDTYVKKHRELQNLRSKAPLSETDIEYLKVTSWPYFKAVSFLDIVLDAAPRYNNTTEESSINQDEPLFENGTPPPKTEVFMDNFEQEGEYAPGTSDSEPSVSRFGISASRILCAPRTEENFAARSAKKRKSPEDDFKEDLPTCSKSDTYDALGAYLAARLRELDDLDPVLCEEWILQVEKLQSGLSKEIREFKKKNLRR